MVKRVWQLEHSRLRRIAIPISMVRESTTREFDELQDGHNTLASVAAESRVGLVPAILRRALDLLNDCGRISVPVPIRHGRGQADENSC